MENNFIILGDGPGQSVLLHENLFSNMRLYVHSTDCRVVVYGGVKGDFNDEERLRSCRPTSTAGSVGDEEAWQEERPAWQEQPPAWPQQPPAWQGQPPAWQGRQWDGMPSTQPYEEPPPAEQPEERRVALPIVARPKAKAKGKAEGKARATGLRRRPAAKPKAEA